MFPSEEIIPQYAAVIKPNTTSTQLKDNSGLNMVR